MCVPTQESFEALDDNGNGRLSAKELRAGLKDMINIVFSVSRSFLVDLYFCGCVNVFQNPGTL